MLSTAALRSQVYQQVYQYEDYLAILRTYYLFGAERYSWQPI
jgi:hypothetical protein